MSDPIETAASDSRARAREGIVPCRVCFTDGAGNQVLCPQHSRFEVDGTPREANIEGEEEQNRKGNAADTASTLLAALAGDARPFVAAFDYELNASGLSGKKRAFLYTLIRLTYKGKACAYAGVAPSTVSLWRKDD